MDGDENSSIKEFDLNVEDLANDNKIGNANRDELQQTDSHQSTAPPKKQNITGEFLERNSKKFMQKKLTSDGESDTDETVTEDNANELQSKELSITGESMEHNLKKFLQKKLLSDGESDIEEPVVESNTNKQSETQLSDESDDDDIAINKKLKNRNSRILVSSDSEVDDLNDEQNVKKKCNEQNKLVSDSGLIVSDGKEDNSALHNNSEDLNNKCNEQTKLASNSGLIAFDGDAKEDNLEDLNNKDTEDFNPTESPINDQNNDTEGKKDNRKEFRGTRQDSFECTSETNRLFRGQKTVLPRNTVPSMNFEDFWKSKKQLSSSEQVIDGNFEASSSNSQGFGPNMCSLEIVNENTAPRRLQPFKLWNQNQNSAMNTSLSLSQNTLNYKAKLLEAIKKKKEQAYERQLQVQQEDEELVPGVNEDLSEEEFSGDEDEGSSGDESEELTGDEGEETSNPSTNIEYMDESPDLSDREKDKNKDSNSLSNDIEKMDESPDISDEEKDKSKDSSYSSEDIEKMDESSYVSDERKHSSEDYELSEEEKIEEDDNFSSSYIPSYQPGGGFPNNINENNFVQDTQSYTGYTHNNDTPTSSNEQLTDTIYYKAGALFSPPSNNLLGDEGESQGFTPSNNLLGDGESQEFIPNDENFLGDAEDYSSTLYNNNAYPLPYINIIGEFDYIRREEPSARDVLPFCSGTFHDDKCEVSSTQDDEEKKDQSSPQYFNEGYPSSQGFNNESQDACQVSSTQGGEVQKDDSSCDEASLFSDIMNNSIKRKNKRKKLIFSDCEDSDDEKNESSANMSGDKVDICGDDETEKQESDLDKQETHNVTKRRHKKKRVMASLESKASDDEEFENNEEAANESNKVETHSDYEIEEQGSDVDEQEAHKVEQYFDNEAELSGEDVSEDENVEDGDYAVDDDVTLPSDEKMRSEIGCLVAKQMIDDDTYAVKLLKEQFLEHGDLYSDDPGRNRKFTWYNKDEDNVKNDSNDDLSETENDLNVEDKFQELQKEKLKWKNEQPCEDDVLEVEGSLKLKKSELKLDIIGKKENIKRVSIDPLEISCNPGPSGIPHSSAKRKRESVVSSQASIYENTLKKLKNSEGDASGSVTTKHFVFSNSEEKKKDTKSHTVSTSKQKPLPKSPEANTFKSSIFKHL